jgi:hypothetical protein
MKRMKYGLPIIVILIALVALGGIPAMAQDDSGVDYPINTGTDEPVQLVADPGGPRLIQKTGTLLEEKIRRMIQGPTPFLREFLKLDLQVFGLISNRQLIHYESQYESHN